jgi:hypothetical protein
MAKTQTTTKTGDAAVDGLLAGLGAGVLMAIVIVLRGLFTGAGIPETLAMFTPLGPSSPLVGAFSHLAVSAIYGAIFGVLYTSLRGRLAGWIGGALYGMLLFLIARMALLSGTGSALEAIPPTILTAAHLVYGLALGLLLGRQGGA